MTDIPDELTRLENLMGALSPTAEVVGQLQRALAGTCEQLRSLGEEHQSAQEDLQSLNEAMHTVNLRLREKIDELDRSNSDLRNLFDSTAIATVFLDRHLVIRSFTPAIASLYDLISSDHGRPLTDIAGRLQYTTLREDVDYVLSRLEPLERRVVRSDLTAHYVLRILPYREPDSAVSGVLVTFIDVTSIVRAEEALVAADVRKDVFLATLSHELRNPLAPIRIAAQLLQSPKLSAEELRKSLLIIARQVTHMSALLDDLLDVSRITRGAFLLKRAYVDVQVLLDDAAEAVRAAGQERRHTLRVEGLTAPLVLEVDPIRITQAITNLLTNAVKYTPPGGRIELGVRREAHHLAIFVRDNGIGLRAEAVDRIFDMFTRVDSGVRNSEGGLGIGLALARGLVELHGGRLKVHSAGPGQGSEFLVCLPSSLVVESPARAAEAAGESATRANPRRVLVADDNRDAAETMGMLLRTEGHEVHIAHTGSEALEIAERVRPEIALLDIGMPDLDGYHVAERLRHEAWGKDMTLIAVTGWGQDADKRRARAAGFNQHVTKPVDPVVIARMLRPVIPLAGRA